MSAIASALVLSLAMLAETPKVLVTVYPIHHNERLRVCECGDWQGHEDWVARASFVRRWQSHGVKIDSCGRSVNVGSVCLSSDPLGCPIRSVEIDNPARPERSPPAK